MALKFFVVPVMDAASSEMDANGFLGCHRVISVDRHFVEQGNNSFWSLCVEYIPGGPAEPSKGSLASARNRVDYKLILDERQFALFSRLRDLRKNLAQKEAVPVYALFTNEQLAQFVQKQCKTKSEFNREPHISALCQFLPRELGSLYQRNAASSRICPIHG